LKYASRDWEPAQNAEPKWYSVAKKKGISYSQTIVQDLCDLTYFGQEVVYDREQKFMFKNSSGILAKVFSPKKGPATKDNCGSLFGADFVQLFEEGSLQSQNPIAQQITSTAAELSYWTSVRARLQIINLQRVLFTNTTL
jgi:hypothetical protein